MKIEDLKQTKVGGNPALNPHLFGGGLGGVSPPVPSGQDEKRPIANAPKPKRIRQSSKPLMNKLETQWYDWLRYVYQPPSFTIKIQAMRFKLGNGIWYKPDFTVWGFKDGPIAYEVKGPHAFRGGLENLKVAAGLYPEITWKLVWRENGQWCEQMVLP